MFAGVPTLIKLILRRDRIKLPVWIGGIVLLLLSMVPLLANVYGDEESLQSLHAAFSTNPAGLFLTGPFDTPTLAGLMTIETLLWWGLAIAFMNVLLVVRHTRQNEEMGAQELLLSGRVHRTAGLTAALLVAVGANVVMTVGLGLGMQLLGGSHWGAENAWLFAIAMGLFGLAWAAIAAVVVQLASGTRTASGMLALLIGASFVVRGIGDFTGQIDASGLSEPSLWSSFSPFGWMQATRALTYPDWQPLLAPAVFSIVMTVLAFVLMARRDIGEGIIPARKGRVRASGFLRTPLGFTWYLQKNVFIGWLIATIIMAATIGVLVPEMSGVYDSNDSMRNLVESLGGSGALIPAFLSAMLSIMALMAAAYVLHGLSRLRAEESSRRLENLLATRLSRLRWLGLHVCLVLIGGSVILAAAGLALALCVNLVSDGYRAGIIEYMIAGLSYTPVLLLFGSLYMLLFGLLPRAAGVITWTYYGLVVFLSWLGPVLQLSPRVTALSVMEHVSAPPIEPVKTAPVLIILAAAFVLILIGMRAWRSRNLS